MSIDDRERRMVEAHTQGRQRAPEVFAIACREAMEKHPGDEESQFSYLAGFIMELRRIATQQQNKGVRLPPSYLNKSAP